MVEGHLAGLLQRGKYHSDYPEENNIISGHQYIGGIEVFQLRRLVRHPSVEKGHRAEENQVSRVSSS